LRHKREFWTQGLGRKRKDYTPDENKKKRTRGERGTRPVGQQTGTMWKWWSETKKAGEKKRQEPKTKSGRNRTPSTPAVPRKERKRRSHMAENR